MLATSETVATIYLVFWSVELVQTLSIIYFLIEYYMEIIDIIKLDTSALVQDAYYALTVGFAVASIMKLIGLMGVYGFKSTVHSQQTAHYVMAGLGFGSCIVISIFLFIRRVLWWNHAISSKRADTALLVFNFLYVSGILASAIVFFVQILGIPEMTLSFLLQGEMLILIYDIWRDPVELRKTRLKQIPVQITLALKQKRNYLWNMLKLKLSHSKKHLV
jgi:hypothetical protein